MSSPPNPSPYGARGARIARAAPALKNLTPSIPLPLSGRGRHSSTGWNLKLRNGWLRQLFSLDERSGVSHPDLFQADILHRNRLDAQPCALVRQSTFAAG